jgi:ubiquinone/menaquinone biosynthesis C-methylase UbiE
MDETPKYGSSSLFRDTTKLTPDEAQDLVRRLELRAKADDEVTARAEYLSLLEIGSGQRVLDIGCGSGVIARDVARRVQPNGRVVGIDSSPALIAAARELTTATDGATSITFREGDCRALPLADDSFDVVIAATVLTHVPDGHRAILEMARVVRPGGRVGVFDFDGDGLLVAHPDRDMTRRIVAAFSDHSAVNGWLVRELPGLFKGAGLKDIRVRGFMPLEQHEGSFYARMGERAAAVALEVGAITPEQHEKWMEALRDRVHSGEFLGGRLHLFCWGRKP